MPRPSLSLVSSVPDDAPRTRKPRAKPTPESAAALMARAKSQGRRLSLAFADDLDSMVASAKAIAAAGDAVPVGVRELASRIASGVYCQALTVRKLVK